MDCTKTHLPRRDSKHVSPLIQKNAETTFEFATDLGHLTYLDVVLKLTGQIQLPHRLDAREEYYRTFPAFYIADTEWWKQVSTSDMFYIKTAPNHTLIKM